MNSTHAERLQLVGVLALASILRMAFTGSTEFKADEARLYAVAYDLASGKNIPLYGIGSSIGLPNFPLSAWIYALPIWLWKHPYAPIIFTGLLNTLAVFACWWFARRYWGTQTGILAALFFAVNPWAVIFSRKIWAQNLLPLFVISWAVSGIMTYAAGKRRAAIIHGVLLGCVPQIHFSGFALIPISIITALIYRQRVPWRWLISGAAIATVIAAPLLFHIGVHGMSDFQSMNTSPALLRADSVLYTWMLGTGTNIHALAGSPAYRDFLQTAPDLSWVHWLWGGLMVFGCWKMFRVGRGPEQFIGKFVIAWLIAPALLLLRAPMPVYLHYFIITLPAQHIAAAVGASNLLDRLTHPLHRATGRAILLASTGLQVWALVLLLQFLSLRATPGGYGTPLAMKLAAAVSARTAMQSSLATEVIIVGNGNDPSVHEFPAVYDALLRETPHRFVDGAASAVRNLSPVVVLLQNGQHPARQHYLMWSSQVISIPMRIGEGTLKVLKLPPLASEIIPTTEFSRPNTLANGVTLLGYQATPEQNGLRWELHWLPGDADGANYHFFNHLSDVKGKRVGQADLPAYPAAQWREGDRVISFFFAPLADHPETIRVGMYTYPDIVNVPVVDSAGQIVGDALTAKWSRP